VTGLGYSVHPSAEAELQRVTEGVPAKFPDVIGVAAVHRVGDLGVGDLAVVVGVSCAHWAEAFRACHDAGG
jgi:molybdopterin synthase catalytic subunit